MRLLVDQNLPPRLATLLTDARHDTIHVRDIGLASATDREILDRAAEDDRIIVSADTDFGALLAQRRTNKPSVILVRALVDLAPDALAERILGQLADLDEDLSTGSVVALTPRGARVRRLPLR